jgi:hypothetical protein
MDPFSIFDWAVVIIFLVITSNLRGRISKLEQLLKGQVIEVEQVPQEMAVNPLPSPVTVSTSFVPPQVIKTPEGPTLSEKLGAWLKEDWLLKLGAALLIIGFGWFTNYAFVNNWVGPVGRVTLGLIAGALFLILGWWRIRSFVYQGGIFLALGSTIILITVYAARVVLDLFDPASALGIMFLSTAKVHLVCPAEIVEIRGSEAVESVRYRLRDSGEERDLPLDGIFIEIGWTANAGIAEGLVELNAGGEIVVDHKTQRTSAEGIWAAGDVTDALYKQNNTSMGDAIKAVLNINDHLHAS